LHRLSTGAVGRGSGSANHAQVCTRDVAQLAHVSFDISVLAFALLATCIVTILFGMLPALVVSRPDLNVNRDL
jgi:hypothetical protein